MKLKNRFEVKKPWGEFEQFTLNEQTTVKILRAEANQSLSLQYHHKRDEFWKILKGSGKVVINNDTKDAKEGDEFVIPKNTKHRMMTEDEAIEWLEISFGDFDEEDIVRLEDKYNRA